jgi:hypothetical protein
MLSTNSPSGIPLGLLETGSSDPSAPIMEDLPNRGWAQGSLRTGKSHYWIDIIFAGAKSMHFLRALGHIPAVKTLFFKLYKANLLPDKIIEPRRKQLRYADEKIAKYAEQMAFMMTTTNSADRRLNTDATRPDFLQKMISVREKQGITVQDLKAQASLLTIAGSETTATALAGITYYLCRTPQVYDNLAREIREAFSSYQQINGRSIEPLPYLRAVIEEGLRIYPPVPIGLPRLSPGATVDGHYVPRRTVVYVTSWAATTQREKFPPTIRVYPRALVGPELWGQKEGQPTILAGEQGLSWPEVDKCVPRASLDRLTFGEA